MLNLLVFEVELLLQVLYLHVLEIELVLKAPNRAVQLCNRRVATLELETQVIVLAHLLQQQFKQVLALQFLKLPGLACIAGTFVVKSKHVCV